MPKDISNQLCFTKISESNIDDLSEGLSKQYLSMQGRTRDTSYWRWCYLDNPIGKSSSIVAVRNGRVVGKFGNVYLKMRVQGKVAVARLMEGLAVDPDERSWRCYAGLVEKSHMEQSNEDISFGFALSTPDTARLSLQTGVVSLGRAPLYSGFISVPRLLAGMPIMRMFSLLGWVVQPFLGLKTNAARTVNLDIHPIDTFDQSFDRLWHNMEQRRTLSLVKDAEFLNWRYVKCPDRNYSRLAAYEARELKGFIVLRTTSTNRDGFIFELQALNDDKDTLKALLANAIQGMKKQRVGLVSASFDTGSPQAEVLTSMGFKTWGTRLWNMEITITTNPKKDSCPELDLKNWSFSLGDWLYYLNPGKWY